jgi:hypothetical protein
VPTFTIPPLESVPISLLVTPRTEGKLTLDGCEWVCNGLIRARHDFRPAAAPPGASKEQVAAADAASVLCTVRVTAQMPVLAVSLAGLGGRTVHGQVRAGSIELVNRGSIALADVRVVCDSGSFLVIGGSCGGGPDSSSSSPSSVSSSAGGGAAAATVEKYSAHDGSPGNLCGDGVAVPLPVGTLEPGQSATVPVWVRGHRVGDHTLRMVFRYGAPSAAAAGPVPASYRTTRTVLALAVAPSLRVTATSRPRPLRPGEFVVALAAENNGAAPVALAQVTAVSATWSVEPLPGWSEGPVSVQPGETVTTYLRAVPLSCGGQVNGGAASDAAGPRLLLDDDDGAGNVLPAAVAGKLGVPGTVLHTALGLGGGGAGGGDDKSETKNPAVAPLIDASATPHRELPHQDESELQGRMLALGASVSGRNRAGSMATAVGSMPMFAGAAGAADSANNTSTGSSSSESDISGNNNNNNNNNNDAAGAATARHDPWRTAMSLTLFWSGDAGAQGQHHVLHLFPQRPEPTSASTASSARAQFTDEAILRFGFDHAASVEHAFAPADGGGGGGGGGGDTPMVCTVPVRLTVRNCSETTTASTVRFHGFPPEALDEDGSATPVHSPYFWGGATTLIVADRLGPGEAATVTLHACFLAASVYQLNRFRMSATFPGGARPVVFAPLEPSHISIVDKVA